MNLPLTEFQPWPKIARIGKLHMVVTEKLDGTNAQVIVHEDGRVQAASRTRFIYPNGTQLSPAKKPDGTEIYDQKTDNFGFAAWVAEHEEELRKLGVGRHYGEWWGCGIQRGYGLDHKRFSIFNTYRPADSLPACVSQVPVLYSGGADVARAHAILATLSHSGSVAAPGFMDPEGIIVRLGSEHYKLTFDPGPKGAA